MLLKYGALEKRSADVVRTIITRVADNSDCMNYILDNMNFFISLIKDAGDDAYDFKDIVRQKLQKSKEERINEFAQKIDVIIESDDSQEK